MPLPQPPPHHGLVVAAPASGSGKTVVTLGVLRALADAGVALAPRKAGPDYLDPTHLAAAARAPARNLDAWSMSPAQLRAGLDPARPALVEAAMGLYDGAADGTGSVADLAAALGFPVVLVLDVARTSHSAAATLRGFATHRADVRVAGVIANRLGSERHARMVRTALAPVCEELGVAMLGAIPRDARLATPSRHLGLVPASERADAEAFVAGAAEIIAAHVDLATLVALMDGRATFAPAPTFPTLGRSIAVARDAAFAFLYPHALDDWRADGARATFFSPLADEAPAADADAVFLPGGYPELHAARLAAAGTFRRGVRAAATRGAAVYGECGGYMALGEGLTDADGARHAMLGLLPLETSFAERRLHLGYREMRALAAGPLGPAGTVLRGHEHHHATVLSEGDAASLFAVRDAEGGDLGQVGRRVGTVSGSFMHVVAAR